MNSPPYSKATIIEDEAKRGDEFQLIEAAPRLPAVRRLDDTFPLTIHTLPVTAPAYYYFNDISNPLLISQESKGNMLWLLPLGFLATPFLTFVFALVRSQIRRAKSPLRKLPGPPSQSWLYGNVKQIFGRGQSETWDEWMSVYGKTFRFSVMFNVRTLCHPL